MSLTTYDKHYKKENLFGKPYEGLIEFFEKFEPKGKILDLGCGQGRDSIPLAKMGYEVTGADISKVGVDQMLESAEKLNLKIKGKVCDIYKIADFEKYDLILLDSMFHFEKKDKEKEVGFLKRIMKGMKKESILCIFVWKSKRIENSLLEVFKESQYSWEELEDKYVKYPEHDMQYRMYVQRKIS